MQPLHQLSEARRRDVRVHEKKLKECRDGDFVKVRARVVRSRIKEGRDELGYKPRISGVLEDSTCRMYFVSFNPKLCLLADTVVEVEGRVRELPNGSKILIVGERSRVRVLEDRLDRYIFNARIANLTEPMTGIVVTGRISKVYRVLVRRCKKCNRILLDGRCPEGHSDGFYPDLRLSFKLVDETGSIRCYAGRDLTAKLLGIPVSTAFDLLYEGYSLGFSIFLEPVKPIRVDYYRSEDKIEGYYYDEVKGLVAVIDGDSHPEGLEHVESEYIGDSYLDRALLADLLQAYLERNLPHRFLGFYLIKKHLTSMRRVYLYMGFSLDIEFEEFLRVNVYPQIRYIESVKDYIVYRRSRGAYFKSIKNTLVKYRNLVLLAPRGLVGKIVDVLPVMAKDYVIEGKDITLSEYWRRKGIDVRDDEQPLLKVKLYELGGIELVYPPSQCYFEISNGLGESLSYKYSLRWVRREALSLVKEALERLGVFRLEVVDRASGEPALEKLALRLIGREVSLEGDVLKCGDGTVFLARRIAEYEY